MTRIQRLQLSQSECRSELGALLDAETRDEDAIKAKTAELRSLEVDLQAALAMGDEPVEEREEDEGPEGRELRQLTERADLGAIFSAVVEQRQVDGAEAELQQHYGLPANAVPLALLDAETRDGWPNDLETRAVTPAPTNVGTNQRPIIPAVFPMAVAAFLGIPTPTVPVGEATWPVISTSAVARTPAEGADADETTGAFTAEVLSPSRLQASFFYSREDRARFRGMGAALRQNLTDALADGLDKEILVGTNGLLTGTNLGDNDASETDDFASYRDRLMFSRVDGRFAASARDLRSVVGSATYAHIGGSFRANGSDDSALDSIARVSGTMPRVSAHVPAVSSNKQEAIVRRGMRMDMVAPIWEGVTLIPDEVTKAKSGEIVITAVMLHAVKILRADGFTKVETQHA